MRTGIGSTKMVIGGEVDGVWDCKPSDPTTQPLNYVELKTSALLSSAPPVSPRHAHNPDLVKFERKLLKFWAQSFLLGVPKIIVGFRLKDGTLMALQEFETQEIPGMVARNTALWDGNVCVNFAAAFLEWLRTVVKGDGVWRIEKREKTGFIGARKVGMSGSGDILSEKFSAWRRSGG